MKARNNKTGEVVTNFFMAKEFGTISYLDSSKTLRFTHACDGEWTLLEDDDFSNSFDWQSFRAEAAKDILCAMLNTRYYDNAQRKQGCVEEAIYFTNELIKQLKEKEEK